MVSSPGETPICCHVTMDDLTENNLVELLSGATLIPDWLEYTFTVMTLQTVASGSN